MDYSCARREVVVWVVVFGLWKEPALNDRKGLCVGTKTQGSIHWQDRPWESSLHPAQSHVQTIQLGAAQ